MSFASHTLHRLLHPARPLRLVVPVTMLSVGLMTGAGGAWAIVITGSQIRDGSVSARDLGMNSVATSELAPSAVRPSDIAVGAVRSAAIANNSVTGAKIAYGTIGVADIGSNAVGSDEITNGSITAADLQVGAVGADAIQDGSVGTLEIADESIVSTDIKNGSIGSSDIAPALLATLVNAPSRVYLPSGSTAQDPWNEADATENVMANDIITYVSSTNPCTNGVPVGAHGVQFDTTLQDSSLFFSPLELSSADPSYQPVPIRTDWYYVPGHRFSVRMTAVAAPAPNVDDVGIIVNCA